MAVIITLFISKLMQNAVSYRRWTRERRGVIVETSAVGFYSKSRATRRFDTPSNCVVIRISPATQKRRIDLLRFLAILIVTVLSAAAPTRSYGHDLSTVLGGAAFESCAALPTQRCILNLAREVALKDQESREASYLASVGADKADAERSNEDKARVEAAKIEFARMATESLANVASAQAKAGLTDDAEATIQLVRSRLGKSLSDYDIIATLVEALARLGKFDEALGFARGGDYPYVRGQLLTTVAIHKAYVGQLSQGLELLLPLPPYGRHLAIRRFAWAVRYKALDVNFQKVVHSVLRMSADVAKRH